MKWKALLAVLIMLNACGDNGNTADTAAVLAQAADTAPAVRDTTALALRIDPYKDALIAMDWNTNVMQSAVSGRPRALDANLHVQGLPYAHIELTPMVGLNDVTDERMTLADATAIKAWAVNQALAAVHWWSYDRDTDCAADWASPECNSMGARYSGRYGYLAAFRSGPAGPSSSRPTPIG